MGQFTRPSLSLPVQLIDIPISMQTEGFGDFRPAAHPCQVLVCWGDVVVEAVLNPLSEAFPRLMIRDFSCEGEGKGDRDLQLTG
jgi:hypothetical protein